MNKTTSIKYKAAFLLIVFALNTVVGFACAMGADMGFNSKHHHDEDEVASASVHHDHDSNSHHHEEAAADKSKDDDNCCHNSVVQLSAQDKLLANVVTISLESPVTLVFLHSFYISFLATSDKIINQENGTVRWQFPASPDIRVSIQSFLI